MTQRWNGGVGAVTCDACGVIYKYGFVGKDFRVHLCDECDGRGEELLKGEVHGTSDNRERDEPGV